MTSSTALSNADAPSTLTAVTVVVADDRPLIRAGIRAAVSSVAAVTADTSLSGLVATVKADRPDVLVVGVRPEARDPFEEVRRLTSLGTKLRVLTLTETSSMVTIRQAVMAGVDSFLLIDATPAEIADGVAATARGERIVAPEIAMTLARARQDELAEATGGLSAVELQVLTLLAEGLTNREVGEQLELPARTVKTHVQGLFEKLDVSDRTAAVARALRHGLIN